MPDNEESILLAFKESGVEFIEEASRAVGELTENFAELGKTAQAQAIEVLKEEGTVVEDLKEKIRKLKDEHEALNDAMKAGLVGQSKYKEQSDNLLRSIGENETVLKRLTAAETEKKRIDAEAEAALKKVTAALDEETAAAQRAADAVDKLAMQANRNLIAEQERLDAVVRKNQATLEAMAGEGEGESATGGLKGVAGSAMKAEKAIHSLASGSGLGRFGSMLEGVMGPLGLPGVGLAIGALVYELEPAIPKIREFFDAWEMGTKKVDDVTAALERLGRAQGEAREKRALAKIDSKITALEDKQDEQGWLTPREQMDLRRLRERSFTAHQDFDMEAEETKKADAEAKLIAKNLADQARQDERNGADRERADAKAAHDRTEARRKRVEHQQHVEDEGIIDQANAEDRAAHEQERETQRARAQAERDRKQAAAAAARTARESTPEARARQREGADKNALWAEAQRVNQANTAQGGQEATPEYLQGLVGRAVRNRGLGATIAQAVQMAIAQLEQQTADQFARGMQQQMRSYQNNGGRY